MKFTTSVLSGLALCVANVAAQNFGSLPTCAQGCATNAIPASCGLDVKCICSTSSFITSVACCISTACSAADQQTTIQFADQLCAGAGITNLPSVAGCAATGTATGTATGAAGGAATSKASAASSAVTSAHTSASAVPSSAATSSGAGTASSSASSTSHSGAATPLAKGNGVAAAGAGAAALLAAIFV